MIGWLVGKCIASIFSMQRECRSSALRSYADKLYEYLGSPFYNENFLPRARHLGGWPRVLLNDARSSAHATLTEVRLKSLSHFRCRDRHKDKLSFSTTFWCGLETPCERRFSVY